MKTFIRWFIFYPITLPLMFIYGVPTTAVFLLWEWVDEKRRKGFDSRGAKALRAYGRIISKPFFFLAEVDKRLSPKQKSFEF
jgi:hypothetical protein